MSLWLAAIMFAHAWLLASTTPSAERVHVKVTTTSGEMQQAEYSVWFDPAAGRLALAIGPLGIEADATGLWAAHRLDPTTVAVLTDQPVRTLQTLSDYLPPTATPTAALALARPGSPWVPLPEARDVRWTSAHPITRGRWHLPVGVRLEGTSQAGAIEAVLRDHRLESITLRPTSELQRPQAVASIELRLSPAGVGERVMVNRGAARVASLYALKPLGPAFEPGQHLPAGLKVIDSQGPARYEDVLWEEGTGARLVVFVRAASLDTQTARLRTLDGTLTLVQQDLDALSAEHASASVRFTPIALLDGPGSASAVDRVNAAIKRLTGMHRLRGVYAINDQRRLIERLDPGATRSPMVGVVVGRDSVIRAFVPLTGESDSLQADRASLVASLRPGSARGR